MAAKNLIQQILDNYKSGGRVLSAEDIAALDDFVRFAIYDIKQIGIIGIGLAAAGLTVRTKTGQEFVLDDTDSIAHRAPPNPPALNITGNNNRLEVTSPPRPNDVSITGGAG